MLHFNLQLLTSSKLPLGILWALGLAVWLVAVGAGFWLITDLDLRPSAKGAPPAQWPLASHIPRSTATRELLVFVHPRCPCSQASLTELVRITESCSELVEVRLLLIHPAGASDDWSKTALEDAANRIPRLHIGHDYGGYEASLFGARTSGQTYLYDATGRLLFSGGITGARGHFGANPSSERLISILRQPTPAFEEAMVYGCPLNSPVNYAAGGAR